MSALEIKNLSKIFDKGFVAVDGISFSVNENEVFGLIGPNGSGKTTTQRMLTTILSPTSGEIKFGSRIIATEADRYWMRYRIGYVPQGDCLYRDLTIDENLEIFAAPYKMSEKQKKDNIELLLDQLDITGRRKSLVRNLSGGLAKRASIAAALVHNPKIVFFDEVTMGLDPNSRYQIWKLIKELKKTATIVFTTHYMDEAEELCDRMAILSKGCILEIESPEKIIAKYKAKDLNHVLGEIIEKEL